MFAAEKLEVRQTLSLPLLCCQPEHFKLHLPCIRVRRTTLNLNVSNATSSFKCVFASLVFVARMVVVLTAACGGLAVGTVVALAVVFRRRLAQAVVGAGEPTDSIANSGTASARGRGHGLSRHRGASSAPPSRVPVVQGSRCGTQRLGRHRLAVLWR